MFWCRNSWSLSNSQYYRICVVIFISIIHQCCHYFIVNAHCTCLGFLMLLLSWAIDLHVLVLCQVHFVCNVLISQRSPLFFHDLYRVCTIFYPYCTGWCFQWLHFFPDLRQVFCFMVLSNKTDHRVIVHGYISISLMVLRLRAVICELLFAFQSGWQNSSSSVPGP